MKVIEQYLTTNIGAFNSLLEKNTARMNELMETSKQMQAEFSNLESSNKFLTDLLADIKEQFKQEEKGENNVNNEKEVRTSEE